MRFADELEESRYSKTIAEIKNKQSFHSTGMSRNMPEDVRLTRTSSFGQNNVKGKLDTFDGITTTLSGEMRQLLADTDVHHPANQENEEILPNSQKITAFRVG